MPFALRWGVDKSAWGFGVNSFVEACGYGSLAINFLQLNDSKEETVSREIGIYGRMVWEIGTPTSVSRFEEKLSTGYGIESGSF